MNSPNPVIAKAIFAAVDLYAAVPAAERQRMFDVVSNAPAPAAGAPLDAAWVYAYVVMTLHEKNLVLPLSRAFLNEEGDVEVIPETIH